MAQPDHDELRKRLSSPQLQVPTWTAVALFLTAITSSAWFCATNDPAAGWISVGSWLVFTAVTMVVSKMAERYILAKHVPKDPND